MLSMLITIFVHHKKFLHKARKDGTYSRRKLVLKIALELPVYSIYLAQSI